MHISIMYAAMELSGCYKYTYIHSVYLHLVLKAVDAGTGSVVVVEVFTAHGAVQALQGLEVLLQLPEGLLVVHLVTSGAVLRIATLHHVLHSVCVCVSECVCVCVCVCVSE